MKKVIKRILMLFSLMLIISTSFTGMQGVKAEEKNLNVEKLKDTAGYLKQEVLESIKAEEERKIEDLKEELIKQGKLVDEQSGMIFEEQEVNYENNYEKSWMDYRSITNKDSSQYKLINESGKIHIDEKGLLVDDDGYIGVALGKKYGNVGDRFIIELDGVRKIKVIMVDAKASKDTVNDECNPWNNSYIEMVIDSEKAANHWDGIVTGDFNDDEIFNGNVTSIYKETNNSFQDYITFNSVNENNTSNINLYESNKRLSQLIYESDSTMLEVNKNEM